MTPFLLRRLLNTVVTIFAVVTTIFILIRVAPGDPAQLMAGDDATGEAVRAVRERLALDRPLSTQYVVYVRRMLTGDFGRSYRTGLTVMEEIRTALPFTLQLVSAGIVIAAALGVTLGIVAAWKRGSWLDTALMTSAVVAASVPAFWVGLLLLLTLAYWWPLFPVTGAGELWDVRGMARHLVLPALAVGLRQSALVARMTRTSVLETLGQDYVRTAVAKGLALTAVLIRHVLRNAAVPIVTVLGLEIGYLLGGSIVTEIVFTRPGMGTLLLQGIQSRDYPLVQAVVLFWGVVFVIVNLLVDLTYPVLDPRLRRAS